MVNSMLPKEEEEEIFIQGKNSLAHNVVLKDPTL
jgi:hypothetical protein